MRTTRHSDTEGGTDDDQHWTPRYRSASLALTCAQGPITQVQAHLQAFAQYLLHEELASPQAEALADGVPEHGTRAHTQGLASPNSLSGYHLTPSLILCSVISMFETNVIACINLCLHSIH
ncbi:Hypothetical predicted protein [Pelobates cultripes]|uniref:Uncharacterized protein n=1 Tax=Pelobates cultripes TaxID=61616 RepID=A0AAD1W295_PELCU|nr:Hypothetical predicted protein [Pelobates cultripes]